ncbi:MAG TPA: nucleoside deaminase [Acidobacteriaceae bacterium]|nr:nucleoside deaminase [Acidobacteriaceae bacterium]
MEGVEDRAAVQKDVAGRRLQDEAEIARLVRFTALSFATPFPVPFGAAIVHSDTRELLYRGRNAVAREKDPSAHAETRAVRKACGKLGRPSLAGYTLYSTCEPCPMCMANALWAGVDRVVYGATIGDANEHCRQIHISAREVSERSDMPCEVVGEVMRELCRGLFQDSRMLEAFQRWGTGKR